ncbi:MAG: hypothetical protein CMG45_03770 [Candidatus Marinimicrobia bacterium]|nr:hypothetical protein [Candidatus Neomarinimicrobiota bacterium]
MSIIQQIIKLQNIDSQLQDIAELLGDLPIKVESLKEEESSLITSLESGRLRLQELELGLNKFDGQLKDLNIKIEKHKDQLFLVTNNKQYDALQLEIDHLKSELDGIEIKSLEYTEEKEKLEKQIKSESENLGALSSDLKERRKKLENLMNQSSDQKTKLESDRKTHIDDIDESILNQYTRVQKARGGLSVVSITGSACGGCGAFIPPQIVAEVKSNSLARTCDSCSRFLYWDSE